MDLLAPLGPVYQAGTLSGNPLAVAAGTETLHMLARRGSYENLEAKGQRLADGLNDVIRRHRIRATINRVGSMLTLFFGVDSVTTVDDARRCDRKQFAGFFHGMLKRGIYLPPAPFEALFVSLAHSNADLDGTISAFDDWASERRSRLIQHNLHAKKLAQWRKLGAAPIVGTIAKLRSCAEQDYT